LVAAAVPVPLAGDVCVAKHHGQAVFGVWQGVQHHAAAQAGDTDRITASQPLGGNGLGVCGGQFDAQAVGRSS
jgi:hypothetical protein